MPEIKAEYLLVFSGFVLPGAISLYVYGLLVPQRDSRLQEQLLEAVCFSILNFVLLFWPIQVLLELAWAGWHPLYVWALVIVCFFLAPIFWPFILVLLLRRAEDEGWIKVRARTAWDDFFSRLKTGCWLQVILNDGSVIGGRFDTRSYASAYPDAGHLYIEELWNVDEHGRFSDRTDGRPGVLLRPSDYKYLRVFEGDRNEQQ